jgi:Zn-dependent membrane protease YugP
VVLVPLVLAAVLAEAVVVVVVAIEVCTLSCALNFQVVFMPHWGDDFSRAIEEIANATMVANKQWYQRSVLQQCVPE